MKFLTGVVAAAGLAMAVPAAAQDDSAQEAQVAQFTQQMASLFQAEPLTDEQKARLPAASMVVYKMMPDGFYAEMMGRMMDTTMAPLMDMFAGPDMVLMASFPEQANAVSDLDEAQKEELATIVDPAFSQRSDAVMDVLMGKMTDMFSVLEPPMRDGLSRAYAVRFTGEQLDDIADFFATPTGSIYARESMVLFADPQVMSAMMSSLPQMMQGMGDIGSAMEAAVAELPQQKSYADLSAAERARIAELLGVSESEVAATMKSGGNAGEDEPVHVQVQ